MSFLMKISEVRIDYTKMKRAEDNAARYATNRQLAFIRTRARTRILRKRKKVSESPNPPNRHAPMGAYAALTNIRFEYNKGTKSGIVGPVKLNQVNMTANGSIPVPRILEEGGTVSIHEVEQVWPISRAKAAGRLKGLDRRSYRVEGGNAYIWTRRDMRFKDRGQRRRIRRAHYKPRPYMSKALEAEIEAGTIMDPWKDAFGRQS